ncbi:MAG: ABC transporter permease [Chitinivibrionales bacterium]|nr:ABC transporter permease [Chitinivibrionales bacterium]
MFRKHPTARYIFQRGKWYLLTFFVAISLNFLLPRLGKANPVDIVLAKTSGGKSTHIVKAREERYLKDFGLVKLDSKKEIVRDKDGNPVRASLWDQYVAYIKMCLKGDLGTSFMSYPKKVSEIVSNAVMWDFFLQLPAILLGWFIGNLLGAYAAYKRGIFDYVFFPLSLLATSIPFFAFGMLLKYVFAVVIPIFPASGGYASNISIGFTWEYISSVFYYYVLPFMSIFPVLLGGQSIGMRSMGIYELGTDYIKYASWLGIKENTIITYVFRNAMLPQLTGLALSLGAMIGGALIAEIIFSYPGLGTTILKAIQGQDYTVIQGTALLVAIMVLVANFTVDILIGFFDPRVKAGMVEA